MWAFADAILNNKEVPNALEDAHFNMKVVDAIILSDVNKGKVAV